MIIPVVGQPERDDTLESRVAAGLATQFERFFAVSNKVRELPEDANLYIQWGYRLTPALSSAMANGLPFLILDKGYFENRDTRFSISVNGFHGLGMDSPHVWGLASRDHPILQPRREPGEYVYVYGQRPNCRSLRGIGIEPWIVRAAQIASETLVRPAKLRLHPSQERNQPQLENTYDETFCAVSWTSTAAVQAAVAGVETLALHPASPAWPVSAHSFGELDRPRLMTRKEWLHQLSHKQYGFHEFRAARKYVEALYEQAAQEASVRHYDTEGLRP